MIALKIAFILIGLIVIAFCLLVIFPIITIEGDSMFPTFIEGEKVIGCRLLDRNNCKKGKIYVIHLRDDENGEPYFIIKRLERVYYFPKENVYKYYFLGDNRKVSADSRQYGLFESKQIVAVIIGKKGRR